MKTRKQLLKEAEDELKQIRSGLNEDADRETKDLLEILSWTSKMLNTIERKWYNEIKQLHYAISGVITRLEGGSTWDDIDEDLKKTVRNAVGRAVWQYKNMESSYNLAKNIKSKLR